MKVLIASTSCPKCNRESVQVVPEEKVKNLRCIECGEIVKIETVHKELCSSNT